MAIIQTRSRWRHDPVFYVLVTAAGVAVALVLSVMNGWFGPLNQDEGWYLLAARQIYRGAIPYRDFAFTQGPVMPVIYAPLTPFITRWGLAFARAATIALGWLTAITAAMLAGRLVKPSLRWPTVCATWILISVNVYHSYFTSIVKTYAVAGLFITAGFYLLFMFRDRPSRAALIGAAAAFVLAAGARVSLVVVGPVMLAALWRMRRWWPGAWWWFGLSGGLAALLVFGPFALLAPEGFWFGMVEYHAARSPGSLFETLALKAGFVSRVCQGYYGAVILGVLLLVARLYGGGSQTDGAGADSAPARAVLRRAAGIALALVTVIHFLSPFPYDDYQAVIYAPVCALLVAAGVRRLAGPGGEATPRHQAAILVLLVAATLASFASPINQEWFVSGRDRIWWHFKPRSDLGVLRDAAERVRALYGPDDRPELLTQDAYLAIETGLQAPVTLTMGPFSYFPEMSTERARRLRVVNQELMMGKLRRAEAPVAAFSGYGLAIAAPEITELPEESQARLWRVLRENYELHETIANFGQAHTTLRILRRRDEGETARSMMDPGE